MKQHPGIRQWDDETPTERGFIGRIRNGATGVLIVILMCLLGLFGLVSCSASPMSPDTQHTFVPQNPCSGIADQEISQLGPYTSLYQGDDTETFVWYNNTAHEAIATLVLSWGPGINGCFAEWN